MPRRSTTKGFARTSRLLEAPIRRASETRGFSEHRVLTQWAEIAGAEIAAICRPVKVGFGRGGVGATLTLLTTGAQAPMLEMRKERIRERVNAAYGYQAISSIRITQSAPGGFADGQVAFEHAPRSAGTDLAASNAPVAPELARAASAHVENVKSQELRQALEALATNILSKSRH